MAEALVRSLLKLAVTVGVLAAVYLFILKPVLDTTNNTIDRAFEGSGDLVEQIQRQVDDSGIEGAEIDLDSTEQAQRMLRCVQRANGNVNRIQRCVRRFG